MVVGLVVFFFGGGGWFFVCLVGVGWQAFKICGSFSKIEI